MEKEGDDKLGHVLDARFQEKVSDILGEMKDSFSVLYESAVRDSKTGLYNNNFFQSILKIKFDKAEKGKQRLSLFLADIDHFKKINDTYGHIKADEILAHLAKIFLRHIRESDVAARFGGEEFFILLPETSLEDAKIVTSRIRDAIKNDKLFKKYGVTISGGLTEYILGDSIESLLKRCDKAMYAAKETGRDRFVAMGPNKEHAVYHIQSAGRIKISDLRKISKSELIGELKGAYKL